ncbi:MAG: hypothetical protein E5X53_08300 [Mesorhizobium sp.]|uniref:hypothetical protein n=1 Tax=Mesorhizobium sp. TaxID=1871066 RepID=UPI000FE4A0CB|nr:hypothetical protein [Mesorhizobium sp.]RWM22699.1 MAG: hypothetical protein EOR73_06650 [Mesorhizobium sp.]TIP75544.1 MAG: hypothetical protein E5X55_04295 [Mesorhizobium sp.]TIQ14216.1 MAG: hypothetical protein E5X57_05690 [Mesorhizobium sp.]TIR53003.1 MAG: hypothetical protein E5X53_08300 [Mesorhizobium sp.]TJV98800.1 MAG: hypothetical protein E5X52_08095 [Mesorhizobium sp.]
MVDCLCRGFPERSRSYWIQALTRLSQRPAVAEFPQYGLALEKADRIVGVVLTLYTLYRGQEGDEVRCNLSSWSVDAEFRPYGAKLVTTILKRRDVTYTNISPAPATLKANWALGFRPFSTGQFAFLPALNSVPPSCRVLKARPDLAEMAMLSDSERYILTEHAALGCLSLICICNGAAFPFVLMPRRILRGLIPCYQVIYCGSLADLSRCAGAMGRFLLRSGILLCVVDAKEPIAGLFGWYRHNSGLKYFKGPRPPSLGDLTFTELVIFGP